MATPAQPRTAPFLTTDALVEALKGAGVTAVIALVLFVPLVGFTTEASQQNSLALNFQWTWALIFTAAVTIGRFLIDIFIWRQEAPFERLTRAVGAQNVKTVLLSTVSFCYVAGGIFLIAPPSRQLVSGVLSGVPASWLSLVMVAMMGVFALVTAMVITRVARLLTGGSIIDRASLTANPGQEFAPGLLLVAVLLPLLSAGPQQRYALDTGMQIVTYLMLGWGLNIVVGLAGLLDLGYVAFYAVGAYTYALLSTHYGMSFWICLPLAGILAAFWGMLLGFPVLRLRGDYLAIVTLAFGEIIYLVLKNWYSFTQGPDGINRIPKLTFFGLPFSASAEPSFSSVFGLEYDPVHSMIFFYYVILVLALFTNFVTSRLRRLPIGRAWEALREDEIACKSLGINTVTTKLTAFATGAMFAGLAGTFYATRQGIVSPEVFTFKVSVDVLIIVVLSGLGSQTGIIIATLLVIGSSEFLRELAQYRMLIFGAGMVALMTWRPQGLVGTREPSVTLNGSRPMDGGLAGKGTG